MQDLLDVEGLVTSFPTPRGELRAVDGLSLRLAPGEALGVVGESGSGKSVLVRTIMNLLPRNARVPPEARVRFAGRDVRALPRAEARHFWGPQMAMVFQDPMTSLNPVRTIGRQLTEPMRYHLRLGRRAARDRATELLTQVGIGEPERRLDQYPHELSGGMRQRVMIAIALSCSPKLLIADEPTTALDVTVQKEILDLLTRLRREMGMAMILISHDLGVVSGRTDRTMVMYAGRAVEVGPTAALFARTRHPYTAALLRSMPLIDQPSHTPLEVIPGSPPDLVAPPAGCRFAPRCRNAQEGCLVAPPPLDPDPDEPRHRYACLYPVGTERGRQALAENRARRRTGAGLDLAAVGAGAGKLRSEERGDEGGARQPLGAASERSERDQHSARVDEVTG
ncbi:ABC transporter ATP-binding protein [Phytohabitans kaempferiae]|uniref:ABC transporter ATP-binding protein n=1 Tax=Phytohabitans kaempferiae TaxID=1620943 RepID=A0ABV6LZF8_9ACTN